MSDVGHDLIVLCGQDQSFLCRTEEMKKDQELPILDSRTKNDAASFFIQSNKERRRRSHANALSTKYHSQMQKQ